MLAAYTELKNAEKVKQFLIKKNIFHPDFLPVKEMNSIYFPLKKRAKVPKAKTVNTKFSFPSKVRPLTIEDLLKNKLTQNQLILLPKSQEVVGEILILEIPEKLEKKEKLIAEAYLKLHRNIKTVAKKQEMHSGVFRTRKVKILAGKRTKETTHFENGVKIKLNLEQTYFSARSGNERLRISKLVKKGENVLVMFSGAAPFPLVIAKKSLAKSVVGIELNPYAFNYAIGNVDLNNLDHKISLLRGDVRKIIPKMKQKFNRIVMPLPKTGEEFLDLALKKSKKGTVIHLYAFLHETEINKHAKKVSQICKDLKRPVRISRKVKCGQFSPGTFRICFELTVL